MSVRSRTRCGLVAAALASLLAISCGQDSVAPSRPGTVVLDAVWEGSTEVPPVVRTIEVRVESEGRLFRAAADSSEQSDLRVDAIPAGPATVRVLGYDVSPPRRPDGEIDLDRIVAFPPSYASEPVPVLIVVGEVADAGTIFVHARPFATDLVPSPGASGVSPASTVTFVLAFAVGDLVRDSIQISVDGRAQVVNGVPAAGAQLSACEDGGANPCSQPGRGLRGFRFRSDLEPLPPSSEIDVRVQSGEPLLDFVYRFRTAPLAVPSATATLQGLSTATPESTVAPATVTRTPIPTAAEAATPTPSGAAVPTRTETPVSPPTQTAIPTDVSAPTDTPGEAATATPAVATATAEPSPTASSEPSSTATFQPSATPSDTPTELPAPSPSPTPTATESVLAGAAADL